MLGMEFVHLFTLTAAGAFTPLEQVFSQLRTWTCKTLYKRQSDSQT